MKDLKIKKQYEAYGIEESKNIDFIFFTDVKEFDIENELKRFKGQYSIIKIIVIDTLAKMRNKNTEVNYLLEYDEVSKIHALELKYGIAIPLVTH